MWAPGKKDYVKIGGKSYAVLDVHIDCEAAEGPGREPGETGQELSALIAVGMVFIASKQEKFLHQEEFCLEPLANRVSSEKVETYWKDPKNVKEWESIRERSRSRLETLDAIRALLKQFTDCGWTLMFFARPVAFDWTTLKQAFTTAGVEIASKRLKTEQLSQDQLLDQICTPYSLAPGQPRPDYYTKDNKSCFPFGFGGGTQATDVGQRMAETAFLLGIESFDFRRSLQRLHDRLLTHNGLQDAVDQAKVWYHYRHLLEEWKEARSALSRFVIAITDANSSNNSPQAVLEAIANSAKVVHEKEEALRAFLQ